MSEENITAIPNMPKKRVDWIDVAKGITIILTIIGHTVSDGKTESITRGLIYSFHMPLFFILSLVTFRLSNDASDLKRNIIRGFRHLIIPTIVIVIIRTILQCSMINGLFLSKKFWLDKIYTWIFCSGVNFEFNRSTVYGIGAVWFFVVLFIGRIVFDYCHLCLENDNKLLIISVILGMIGVFWGQYQWMPFSLDLVFAIQPFFYWGYHLKNYCIDNKLILGTIIYGAIWLCTLYLSYPNYQNWTYLELAVRRYNFFPICYITAITGTMFISKISFALSKFRILTKPIIFIGKNSLFLLSIHIFDDIYSGFWNIENHQFYSAFRRTIADLVMFLAFMYIRYVVLKFFLSRKNSQKNIASGT